MKREVYLQSLTAGRCFTWRDETEDSVEESGPANAGGRATVQQARTMMSPESAWKVVGHTGDEATVENAAGETRALPLATKVVEIPREGWQRLVARG